MGLLGMLIRQSSGESALILSEGLSCRKGRVLDDQTTCLVLTCGLVKCCVYTNLHLELQSPVHLVSFAITVACLQSSRTPRLITRTEVTSELSACSTATVDC